MITPPEWLQTESPGGLKIWGDVTRRLEKLGRLVNSDPECLAAYCHCLERSSHFDGVDPKLVMVTGYKPRPGENPVSVLWRRAAEYCAVRLGLIKPKHISYFEILLDDGWDELDQEGHLVYLRGGEVSAHLDPHWQVGLD
jgi:hypothetical protein